MKSINYDSEGDILTVTFAQANNQSVRGIELNDNIVLYYDTKTKEPVELILISYQAMLLAGANKPFKLNGLLSLPTSVRAVILRIVRRSAVSNFLQLVETPNRKVPASYPRAVFTSSAMQAVA